MLLAVQQLAGGADPGVADQRAGRDGWLRGQKVAGGSGGNGLGHGCGFDGNKVRMWNCGSYAPAQQWTINSNGTITTGGGCLDIKGAVYADLTPIIWNTCNGGANQQWKAVNGQLVNPVSDKCLDDPFFNTANGTQLVLHTCNGGRNQQWQLP